MVTETRAVAEEAEKDGCLRDILKVEWAGLTDDLDVEKRKSGESRVAVRFWLGHRWVLEPLNNMGTAVVRTGLLYICVITIFLFPH